MQSCSISSCLSTICRYNFLNRFVGSGVSTNIVLLKCFLDQMFFATQQDLLFLGLCAYNESVDTNDALQEVKDTFLTTWIVDCSLWPVVNFVGFAFVPMVLQPTYMAFVSYFWQLYLSSAASREDEPLTDDELETLFKELDTDNVRIRLSYTAIFSMTLYVSSLSPCTTESIYRRI